MTDADYPATPADDVTYTYDETSGGNKGVGRLTKIEDGSGSIAFTYDPFNRSPASSKAMASTSYRLSSTSVDSTTLSFIHGAATVDGRGPGTP